MNTSIEAKLLIDIGAGVVLDAPPVTLVTRRWAQSHPFVELQRSDLGWRLLAGPDAKRVARGAGGDDYVTYEVVGETLPHSEESLMTIRRTR